MSPEKINEELKRISSLVPKDWLRKVAHKVKLTPDIEFVVKKAIEEGNLTPEKRKEAQDLLDQGEFSKTKLVASPKYEKLLSDWYSRQINKSIREGRLPKAKSLKDPFLKKIHNNENKETNP